jgi:prepilin-type processing-associated H-X9-DG protein
MATSRTRKRPGARRFYHSVAKPSGLLHPRVPQVGPEHFGIVCLDCANANEIYSFHTGGANVLFGDGSVHMLRAQTSINIVIPLLTRSGGEVLPSDALP